MGSVLASTILDDAGVTLLDETPTRWKDPEKFTYLNDGQRLAVLYKPDANAVIDTYRLVEGSQQCIPDGSASYKDPAAATLAEAIILLNPICNMGLTGIVSGKSIDVIDLKELNASDPEWHLATASAVVESIAFDERYPKYFFTYPPQPATPGYIKIAYSALPADIATTADVINLSDRFQTALYYYVVHRCYTKDAALSPFNASRAMEFWNLFVTELGRLDLIKKGVSPNVKQPAPSPSIE